jgi:hypothetical protein
MQFYGISVMHPYTSSLVDVRMAIDKTAYVVVITLVYHNARFKKKGKFCIISYLYDICIFNCNWVDTRWQ